MGGLPVGLLFWRFDFVLFAFGVELVSDVFDVGFNLVGVEFVCLCFMLWVSFGFLGDFICLMLWLLVLRCVGC